MEKIILGVVKGSHLPANDYIFDEINDTMLEDPTQLTVLACNKLCKLFGSPTDNKEAYLPTLIGNDSVVVKSNSKYLELLVDQVNIATISVLNICYELGIKVILQHYNKEKNSFIKQTIWNPLL